MPRRMVRPADDTSAGHGGRDHRLLRGHGLGGPPEAQRRPVLPQPTGRMARHGARRQLRFPPDAAPQPASGVRCGRSAPSTCSHPGARRGCAAAAAMGRRPRHAPPRVGPGGVRRHAAFASMMDLQWRVMFSASLDEPTSRELHGFAREAVAHSLRPNVSDFFPALAAADLQHVRHGFTTHLAPSMACAASTTTTPAPSTAFAATCSRMARLAHALHRRDDPGAELLQVVAASGRCRHRGAARHPGGAGPLGDRNPGRRRHTRQQRHHLRLNNFPKSMYQVLESVRVPLSLPCTKTFVWIQC